MESRRAVIVGAGIGGLACGLALQRAGWDTEVFERASALRAEGVGLGSNAMRALRALDVADEVLRRGSVCKEINLYNAKGRILVRLPTEQLAKDAGMPHACIGRGELL